MKEDGDVTNLRVIDGGDSQSGPANSKVLRCLREALTEAEQMGWTEVCVVLAKPCEGHRTSMAVESGSTVNLIGSLSLAKRFVEDVVLSGGQDI